MRRFGRGLCDLRPMSFETSVSKYAEGSCLVCFGDTHVLCTATLEEKVPPFMRNSGSGWVTAEYGMLPRATHTRTDREATRGKQTGRTQEIQRLIGRALRAVVDLKALGERQVKIDCDVLQADGGTRTAAISGAYVALHQALAQAVAGEKILGLPLRAQVGAVSCGLMEGKVFLDLDYEEDKSVDADINIVLSSTGGILEIQGTAERQAFAHEELLTLIVVARGGIETIFQHQKEALAL